MEVTVTNRYRNAHFSILLLLLVSLAVGASSNLMEREPDDGKELKGFVTIIDLIDNSLILRIAQVDIKVYTDTATEFSGVTSLADIVEGHYITLLVKDSEGGYRATRVLCSDCMEISGSTDNK